MKKENFMKKECEDVTFAFCGDSLLRDINADSAYIAASLATAAEGTPRVTSLMLTEDEQPFIHRAIDRAYSTIIRRLSAYLGKNAGENEERDSWQITLRLPQDRPAETDALLLHELKRAFVTFVLQCWYEQKSAALAIRQNELYEAALSAIMHDIFMAYGGMKRNACYF